MCGLCLPSFGEFQSTAVFTASLFICYKIHAKKNKKIYKYKIQFKLLLFVVSVEAGDKPISDLTTVDRLCRVVVRDPSGKHCWDSAVLYGPLNCRSGSYLAGRGRGRRHFREA